MYVGDRRVRRGRVLKGIEPEYVLKGSCLVYDSYVEPVEYKED